MKVVQRTFIGVANKTLDTIDRRLLPFVWMGIIFYFSSIPDLSLKGNLAVYDFVLRKLAHISVFAVLVMFWRLNTTHKILAAFLTIAYAVIDELHQTTVPGRNGTIQDVLVDSIGIIIGLWFFEKTKEWKKAHEHAA